MPDWLHEVKAAVWDILMTLAALFWVAFILTLLGEWLGLE